jgi:hypothetical protein
MGMRAYIRFNPQRSLCPYELYIDDRYYASFMSEGEALRAAEREYILRESVRWREPFRQRE